MRYFTSLNIEVVVKEGKGKIWLYSRRDDYFYIVHYDHKDFMKNIANNMIMIFGFFREILDILGEPDARIEWIARYWEKDAKFIGFYCCYTSRNHTYGRQYVVLLVFDEERSFSSDRLELCRKLELMRKIWVYIP